MPGQFKLEGTVGPANDVEPRDGRKLKQALIELGFLEEPEGGATDLVDSATLRGLEAFQKENGLIADGVAKPGGTSERLIAAALAERDGIAPGAGFALSDSVGEKAANRPEDVRSLKRALAAVGQFPQDKAQDPMGRLDADLALGIRAFQRDFNLKRDGLLRPGGRTERTLDRVLKPKRPAGRDMAAASVLDRRRRAKKSANDGRAAVPPISQAFIDKWARRGFGGPRGQITVPTLRNATERIENILADMPARFNIEEDPNADDSAPFFESKSAGLAAVASFGKIIETEAAKQRVDPNLVKAIVFSENARGHRLGLSKTLDGIGLSSSFFPMNIRPDIWAKLGLPPDEALDPEKNIRAGVTLIKRIRDRIENPTAEKIATIYNGSGRETVNDAGAYTQGNRLKGIGHRRASS